MLDGLGATRVPLFEDIETLNAAHRRLLSFEMARHHARWFPRFADRYRPRTAAAIRDGLAVAADDAAQIRAGRANVRARIHEASHASWTTSACSRGLRSWRVLRPRIELAGGANTPKGDRVRGRHRLLRSLRREPEPVVQNAGAQQHHQSRVDGGALAVVQVRQSIQQRHHLRLIVER